MIKGRLARQGQTLRGMNLETFCDIVWSEIWDDCSPMADLTQYRQIVTQIFLEGKDPHDVWYESTDGRGKKTRKRLAAEPARGAAGRRHDLTALRDLMEQAKAAAQAQAEQQK